MENQGDTTTHLDAELDRIVKEAEAQGLAMFVGVHDPGKQLCHIKMNKVLSVQDLFVIFSNLARHNPPMVLSVLAAVQREFDVSMALGASGKGGVVGGGQSLVLPKGLQIVDPRRRWN